MGLCSPSLCALAAPWLGCGTALAAPARGAAALGALVLAPGSTPRGSAASPSQPVARGATSHGWEKIPVQEPVRGPITKPQPGFRMGTGSARARRHRAASGVGATCREKLPRERGSGCPNTTGENTRSCSALCPWAQHPAGTRQTPEWLHQPGPGAPLVLCPRHRAHTRSKAPCATPSPADPSKHPTCKERHRHGHEQTPATATQGKGQPQTPRQPWGARKGAKLAPGPPTSPTGTGNPGWALPAAARPRPRSRHRQGNKNPFGKSSPCSQRAVLQLKGHKGI